MKDSKQVRSEYQSFVESYSSIAAKGAEEAKEVEMKKKSSKKEKEHDDDDKECSCEMVLMRKSGAFTELAERYQMSVKQFARFVEANQGLFDIETRKKAILANKFSGFKESVEWDEFFGDLELVESLQSKVKGALDKAANFMDSGGAPSQERLRLMIGLLMDNPNVKVVFGARFGGISRCDDWARAVVQYVTETRPSKPMIMRMVGNMEKEGWEIFDEARRVDPEPFKNIKIYRWDTPIEEVIKEAIRVARGM